MRWATFIFILLAVGCTAITAPIRDKMHEPGTMVDNAVEPCHNYRTDQQACGNAIWNARALTKIEPGQSRDQVLMIMQRDAERREISGNTETWMYLTDYDNSLMTAITFSDGKVSGLKQVKLKAD